MQKPSLIPTLSRLGAALLASALIAAPWVASAQTIERIKMTDNDLTCQQIYNEITLMDTVISRANQPVAAAPAAPAADPNTPSVGSAVAGAVAQQAIGQAAARGGFGGFGGFGGGGGGGAGGLFGSILGQVAQNVVAPAPQAAAAAPAPAAQQNAALGQQAQGRKEHLTSVFLGKGCKMGDIQR